MYVTDNGNYKQASLTPEECVAVDCAQIYRDILANGKGFLVGFLEGQFPDHSFQKYLEEDDFPSDDTCWIWGLLSDIATINGNTPDRRIYERLADFEAEAGMEFGYMECSHIDGQQIRRNQGP